MIYFTISYLNSSKSSNSNIEMTVSQMSQYVTKYEILFSQKDDRLSLSSFFLGVILITTLTQVFSKYSQV